MAFYDYEKEELDIRLGSNAATVLPTLKARIRQSISGLA